MNKEIKLASTIVVLSILLFIFQNKKFESSISMYPSYGDDLNNSSLMSLVGEFGIGQGMNTTDPIIYVPDIVNSSFLKTLSMIPKPKYSTAFLLLPSFFLSPR